MILPGTLAGYAMPETSTFVSKMTCNVATGVQCLLADARACIRRMRSNRRASTNGLKLTALVSVIMIAPVDMIMLVIMTYATWLIVRKWLDEPYPRFANK